MSFFPSLLRHLEAVGDVDRIRHQCSVFWHRMSRLMSSISQNSKQFVHNRVPGSYAGGKCVYCVCTIQRDVDTHFFLSSRLQVLDNKVKLKRECVCGGTAQFLSKHGFLIHWRIIYTDERRLSAYSYVCMRYSKIFHDKHAAHHITSKDSTVYFFYETRETHMFTIYSSVQSVCACVCPCLCVCVTRFYYVRVIKW